MRSKDSKRHAGTVAMLTLAYLTIGMPAPVAAIPCTLTCPANVFVNGEGPVCSKAVTYSAPSASGSCNTVTCTPASGSTFPAGNTIVTCTASNTAMTTCSFTVDVFDRPLVKCLDQTFDVGHAPGQPIRIAYDLAEAMGTCAPLASNTCSPPPGSIFESGVTEVKCTATDTNGMASTCSKFVTVNGTVVGAPLAGLAGLGALIAALSGYGWYVLRPRTRRRHGLA